MRLGKMTAGALATGALMCAVPTFANAATSNASLAGTTNTPSATASQFAQVADGQSVAQVDQEMGSAGTVVYAEPGTQGAASTVEEVRWNNSSLGGALQFSVTFSGPAGAPGSSTIVPSTLTVSSKDALGLGL